MNRSELQKQRLNNAVKALKQDSPLLCPARYHGQISYSQTGEDIIINSICKSLKIEQPTYLDLGAHHPYHLSNTYFFYKKGCRGVNVEPDPQLITEFTKERSLDTNLNIGVGFGEKETVADFYVFNARVLNTFSQEEAFRVQQMGTYKIIDTIKVPLVPVNNILADHFNNTAPDFVSLDIEGLDLHVLQTWNFKKYRPAVFCVETLTYEENKPPAKVHEIIDLMASHGYNVFADTSLNTIFIDQNRWSNRLVATK